MDIVQLTIVVVSFILTGLIVFLGVAVWQIFKEVRLSIHKMNKMLDDMGKVTGTVGETAANVSGLISGFRSGISIFSGLRRKGKNDDE